jgi:hypothetical protein
MKQNLEKIICEKMLINIPFSLHVNRKSPHQPSTLVGKKSTLDFASIFCLIFSLKVTPLWDRESENLILILGSRLVADGAGFFPSAV